MRLLFIADGRSPIALNWIQYFLNQGKEVHLVTTFNCEPDPRFASFTYVPTAFSEIKGKSTSGSTSRRLPMAGSTLRLRTLIRQWLGPLTLTSAASKLRPIIEQIGPDLVHAMRIPYEGMLAGLAMNNLSMPLLVSVWGNDFTLHAPATPLMGRHTRQALQRADALHADCFRDVRLAREWGFSEQKLSVVLPGAGGVQAELFYPPDRPVAAPRVINPRGFRVYINNEAFFKAIPLVLKHKPDAFFVCPSMTGERQARRWVEALGIGNRVDLLPVQTRQKMPELFRQARIAVSPSNHDGTPNTLLEAMACGCLPVAGDLESVREWITPGKNGLLVDPNDPLALAEAILLALDSDELQISARSINLGLIAERAEHHTVMCRAAEFYQQISKGS
jgi:glycosyltransferase involved in cell wall biosynthesis